jgi:hypothetical protein
MGICLLYAIMLGLILIENGIKFIIFYIIYFSVLHLFCFCLNRYNDLLIKNIVNKFV